LETQKRVCEFDIIPIDGPNPPIGVMSPDNSRVIIGASIFGKGGGRAFAVVAYDTKTGKKLMQVDDETISGTISMAAADNKTVILMSTSGRVWTVDYENGKIEPDIDNIPVLGEAPVWGNIAVSPDGKRFALGVVGEPYVSYGCRVYDLQLRKEIQTFIGHAGPVSFTRFHPDGLSVASGAQDTSVLVWDLSKLAPPAEREKEK
jgi:WD40 repeat protein